jgi:hypothetical protein
MLHCRCLAVAAQIGCEDRVAVFRRGSGLLKGAVPVFWNVAKT